MEAANEACRNIIKNYDVMEPGKPDHYASMKAQLAAKGMVLLAIQEISAIDPAEVLARVVWKGPGEIAHRYSPDWMAQGDCQICGHTQEAHQPAPDAVVRLGEAMKHLHDIINCGNCSGSRQSARLALRALAAMETSHD